MIQDNIVNARNRERTKRRLLRSLTTELAEAEAAKSVEVRLKLPNLPLTGRARTELPGDSVPLVSNATS